MGGGYSLQVTGYRKKINLVLELLELAFRS